MDEQSLRALKVLAVMKDVIALKVLFLLVILIRNNENKSF